MTAFDSINQERQRQIDKGFDAQHDDGHADGSILHAAILAACDVAGLAIAGVDPPSPDGPWPDQFVLHLSRKYAGDDRQKLVIAAALIIAEIERLDRKQPKAIPLNDLDPDDLIKLGFTGGNDEADTDVYDYQVTPSGLIVRVWLKFSRGEVIASGLILAWSYTTPGAPKVSLRYEIMDDPQLSDVKSLLEALGVELAKW